MNIAPLILPYIVLHLSLIHIYKTKVIAARYIYLIRMIEQRIERECIDMHKMCIRDRPEIDLH